MAQVRSSAKRLPQVAPVREIFDEPPFVSEAAQLSSPAS
jgi:hypothetical protein